MTSWAEKRNFPRLATQLEVKFKLLGDVGSPFSKDITNSVGQGGIFIRTKEGYQKDALVEIELTIKGKIVKAKGMVRYLIPFDAQAGGVQFPGMGIQFTEIAFDDQKVIGEYVQKELERIKRKSKKK